MGTDNTPPPQRNTKIRSDNLILLQEIIEEILAILPVKSLLRFRCVSTAWRDLIGSDRFIKLHLQKTRDDKTPAPWRVIFNYGEAGLKQCTMRTFLDKSSIDPSPIEDPTNNNRPISGHVVGSCNGVVCIFKVCIFKKVGFFFLCNPATRILHRLPELDNALNTYGFGWDETNDAYKVFAVVLDRHGNRIGRVYSTRTGSWKTVEQGFPPSLGYGKGIFVCGKTHWLDKSGRDNRIESFDFKGEVFGVIELPYTPKENSWLIKTNGCLGVCGYNEETSFYDVWVMKEYGMKESWVKETRLAPHRTITSRHGSHFYLETLVSPILNKNI